MKVPLRWLAEFIDTGLSPAELAHWLTMAGLEAEKVTTIGTEWDKIFVGVVESVARHPDADRLVLATVDAGQNRLTVVTGAPNIAQDQKVALALAGSRLIDGHGNGRVYKTLKPGVIRGVRSEGMVCSEKELGISDEHEGILVLEAEAPKGVLLADWLGDTVIEFEITPNLVHAFSILGIAREAGALTDQPVTLPPIFDFAAVKSRPRELVTVDATDLCARYVAVVIDGLEVGPSPAWMQRRLTAAGVRPISNIVDVTNYVMLEYGQPLHAFDADRLQGDRIIVRRARSGETMETLDHQVRALGPDMLLIADADHAVGIAGVMGGLESEVTDTTKRILLESANFDMKSVRATARALKLRTDASARFERGLDPNLAGEAAARATKLILDLCPDATVTAFTDVYPHPARPRPLSLPYGEIERLLGVRYEPDQVLDVLRRLGFAPEIEQGGEREVLRVLVPTWRGDVTQAADVVEEIARVIGYETVPERLITGQTTPMQRDPIYLLQRTVRDVLIGAGAFESVSYVAIGEDDLRKLAPDSEVAHGLHEITLGDVIRLRNPLHADRGILRPTLLPSLLNIAAENLKHERGVRLFETAHVYLPGEEELPREANVLAILVAGAREPLSRFASDGELDYFDLKGMVEALLGRLRVENVSFRAAAFAPFHPGRSAEVLIAERRVGILGELRPDRAAAFDIDVDRVAAAEIDLDMLLSASSPAPADVKAPHFLPVEQDFAVIVAEATPAADVQAALLAGAGPLATAVALFDIYRGPQIGDDRKSLAYRVTFTAPDRALTDAELGKVRDRIAKTLRQRVGGELRV